MSRLFALGDILSVTTGRLMSPRGIEAMYDLLGFMVGEPLWTHQLPRACDECTPDLLRQHPQLVDVEVPDEFRDEQHVWEFLAEQVERFGVELPVEPLAPADHTSIDPLTELSMMRPDIPVIAVVVPDGGGK